MSQSTALALQRQLAALPDLGHVTMGTVDRGGDRRDEHVAALAGVRRSVDRTSGLACALDRGVGLAKHRRQATSAVLPARVSSLAKGT